MAFKGIFWYSVQLQTILSNVQRSIHQFMYVCLTLYSPRHMCITVYPRRYLGVAIYPQPHAHVTKYPPRAGDHEWESLFPCLLSTLLQCCIVIVIKIKFIVVVVVVVVVVPQHRRTTSDFWNGDFALKTQRGKVHLIKWLYHDIDRHLISC